MLSQLFIFFSVFLFTNSQLSFFQSIMDIKKQNISIYSDAVIYQHLNALSFCSLPSNHCSQYNYKVIPPPNYQINYFADSDYNKMKLTISCVNKGFLYTFAESRKLSFIEKRYNLSKKDIPSNIKSRSGVEFFYVDASQHVGEVNYNSIPDLICQGYKKSDVDFILVNYIGMS